MLTKQLSNIIFRIVSKPGRGTSPHTDGELNDLSYEDALLDVEIRSFMRAEYSKKVPPAGVFYRVVRAIRLYQQEQKRRAEAGPASRFGELLGSLLQAFVAAYRVGARADMGRIMSGSMVAALLLLALGPNLMQSLGSGDGAYGLYMRALSGGSNLSQVSYPPTVIQESPTSVTSVLPPVSLAGPTPSTDAPPTYVSPGTLYDDPRLLLAHRTGENPAELGNHHSKQPSDATNTNRPNQVTTEPDDTRPFVGQY